MATKAELEARISKLEQKLAHNQELLTWAQNAIDDPDGQFKMLTNEIMSKEREIKALENEVDQLKDEVDRADETISSLNYQTHELEGLKDLLDNKLDENLDIFDSCVGKMCISHNSLPDAYTVELLKALLYSLQPNTVQDELKSLVDKYDIKY